nr:dienelactone hydrolase family protein [Halogranum amylolyticum]
MSIDRSGDAGDGENELGMIVDIELDDVTLEGALVVPDDATGIVVFSHGSGSSRHSPRNNFVAEVARRHGLATLLFDLLTEAEDETYETRFDIDLLTRRLVDVTAWVAEGDETADLRIGYFGSSTGAASALRAAAELGDQIGAVVSRGGRVDLASDALADVTAPTLFVVGEADTDVLALNEAAFSKLTCTKELEVIPGAGHLFEEPGTLDAVAEHAAAWFAQHLAER